MPKPFLIMQLRPEDATADSEFAAILRYGGLEEQDVVRRRVEQTGLPGIDLDDYAAIIVGGSPFDISTPALQKSDIQKQIETDFARLFDDVVDQDFPFLGACSGNGLLGSYCGATISRRFAEPVGGVDISITDAGKADPLLHALPDVFRALVGHKEACDNTPPGAVLLAKSPTCQVQMFRLRNNIYATQFHPESDCDEFILRIKVYKNNGYFPPSTAEHLIDIIKNERTPVAHEILKRFVNRYRR